MMSQGQEEIAIWGTILGVILTVAYKFFRMFKIDRTSDQITNEERAFRESLVEEIKNLKEQNQLLLRERAELLSKVAALEVKVEVLTEKCLNCRYHPEQN